MSPCCWSAVFLILHVVVSVIAVSGSIGGGVEPLMGSSG